MGNGGIKILERGSIMKDNLSDHAIMPVHALPRPVVPALRTRLLVKRVACVRVLAQEDIKAVPVPLKVGRVGTTRDAIAFVCTGNVIQISVGAVGRVRFLILPIDIERTCSQQSASMCTSNAACLVARFWVTPSCLQVGTFLDGVFIQASPSGKETISENTLARLLRQKRVNEEELFTTNGTCHTFST